MKGSTAIIVTEIPGSHRPTLIMLKQNMKANARMKNSLDFKIYTSLWCIRFTEYIKSDETLF